MIYTGIGSRNIPAKIHEQMIQLGELLGELGWILRSGGADGADTAFETGCDRVTGRKEIYLPWKGFNSNNSSLFSIPEKADNFAKIYYTIGNYSRLKPTTKKFMQRNILQVFGKSLVEPSDCVICWTKDGCTNGSTRTLDTGGTGQAITAASAFGIPVFNLRNDGAYVQCLEFILELNYGRAN